MEKFEEILKELVEESGLSLNDLKEASSVSANQYSEYLHGSEPKIKSAIKIAKHFNCSLDYLFGLSINKGKSPKFDYNLQTFLTKYEKILNENKITHYKFSQEAKFNESVIRKWKKGQNPSMEIIIKIATELSISIDSLLGLN